MSERNKLALEIKTKLCNELNFPTYAINTEHFMSIADFIIAERKRIVEPLVKVNNEIAKIVIDDTNFSYRSSVMRREAIDETLKLAGE